MIRLRGVSVPAAVASERVAQAAVFGFDLFRAPHVLSMGVQTADFTTSQSSAADGDGAPFGPTVLPFQGQRNPSRSARPFERQRPRNTQPGKLGVNCSSPALR